MKKPTLFLALLITLMFAFPLLAAASNWMVFTPKQKNGATWYYDKDSITYPRNTSIIGITTWMHDVNYLKMWIKSSSEAAPAPVLYQAEIDCKARTARLMDDNGKGIYSIRELDYLYDRSIPPDTMLDMLRKAVCAP